MQLGLEADSKRASVFNISSVINSAKGCRKTMISHGNGRFLIVVLINI